MLKRSTLNAFMFNTRWWSKASIEQKERAVRILNKKAFPPGQAASLGSLRYDPEISDDDRANYERGLMWADDLRRFSRKIRQAEKGLLPAYERFLLEREEIHDQFAAIKEWQSGANLPPLPPDLRRCRYKLCSQFFIVSKTRKNRLSCSPKCGRKHGGAKAMNKKRERKLEQVIALKDSGQKLDKKQIARRARVTPNFISYAIRRGEITVK
jgi:hypothetical protein